jgi:DNA recombination protein RmuC
MGALVFLILGLILVAFIVLVVLILKKLSEFSEKGKTDEALTEWLKSMQQSLEGTNKTLNEALRSTTQNITSTLQKDSKTISERLDKAANAFSVLQREMGKFSEIGRSMRDLQEFLQSPKLRGNIGEQVLRDLLSQAFPKESFHLQYTFRSGVTVDAAIKTDKGIIPIDSKFPMENFKRMMSASEGKEREVVRKEFIKNVKKHIEDISSKYILTDEGTLDYALMYIPSEPVYYEIVANISELYDFAYKKRVLPVSPSTFYAYLRAILLSLEGKKIEQRAYQILRELRAIQTESKKFGRALEVLSGHISRAYNSMSSVLTGFGQLGRRISAVQALESGEGEEAKRLEMGKE